MTWRTIIIVVVSKTEAGILWTRLLNVGRHLVEEENLFSFILCVLCFMVEGRRASGIMVNGEGGGLGRDLGGGGGGKLG